MIKPHAFTIATPLAAHQALPAGPQAVSQVLQDRIIQTEHRFPHAAWDWLKETPYFKPDAPWESGRGGQATCNLRSKPSNLE